MKLVGWLSCLHPTLIARSFEFQVIQCDQISVDQSSQLKKPAWSIRHHSGSSWLCDGWTASTQWPCQPPVFRPHAPLLYPSWLSGFMSFWFLNFRECKQCYDNLYIDRAPVHHGKFKPTDVGRLWPWELVERLWLHERTDKSYRVKSNVHYLQHSQPLTWLVMITYLYII